jgi:hypothetical protein
VEKELDASLAEITGSRPSDPDDAMVPCAGALSDELTTSHVAPLEVTLIHSNKSQPRARPHSVHRALGLTSPPTVPRPFFEPTLPYNISHSRIWSRLWLVPTRRGARCSNDQFYPTLASPLAAATSFMRARGWSVSRSGHNRREIIPTSLSIVQIPSMTNMPYSIPSHPPICASRPLSAGCQS